MTINGIYRTICILVCASLWIRAFAFDPEEAHRLYAERYSQTPPSVQECGEYLFVIVEGAVAEDRHGDNAKQVLNAQLAALERHIGSGLFGYVSPFGDKLTKRLPAKGGFCVPSCQVVTVEETRNTKRFREVSAYEAGPINVERERIRQRLPSRRSVMAWAEDIRALLAKSPTEEMRERLFAEAGLVVPLLLGPGHSIACHDLRVDGVAVENLFRQWGDQAQRHDVSECEMALGVLPSFSPAHRCLAEVSEGEGRLVHAVDGWMNAAVAGEVDEAAFGSLLVKLSGSFGSDAWREWFQLWRDCRKCDILVSALGKDYVGIKNSVTRSLGRARFMSMDDEQSKELFAEAKFLFMQGKDLPRIVELLERSLARNPGNRDAWRLYGDALRTDKRWAAAVLAYHEALAFDAEDGDAICGAARCYEELGLTKLAASAGWWALLSSNDEKVQNRSILVLKKVHPDAFL